MRLGNWKYLLSAALVAIPGAGLAEDGKDGLQASFSTLITTPLTIEGLTNDNEGNLYTPGRSTTNGEPCPIWRVNIDNPSLAAVGLIPAPSATSTCSPSGLAFGSDGTTGVGRVWRITPAGTVGEVLRIPPMANEVGLAAGVGGVGRDARTLPPGTITVTATSRNAANTAGSQPLVANGLAFDRRGNLFIADTARGAIWKVRFRSDGTVASRMGCDTTFTPNTLCMSNVFVAHPYLDGADGLVLDVGGNMWVSANERNAIIHVQSNGFVHEVFRNAPDPATQLRNTGPLESPANPVLAGNKFCSSNSDGNRRDNSPATAGEIGGTGQPRGKITCLDQRVNVRGMTLPVQ